MKILVLEALKVTYGIQPYDVHCHFFPFLCEYYIGKLGVKLPSMSANDTLIMTAIVINSRPLIPKNLNAYHYVSSHYHNKRVIFLLVNMILV